LNTAGGGSKILLSDFFLQPVLTIWSRLAPSGDSCKMWRRFSFSLENLGLRRGYRNSMNANQKREIKNQIFSLEILANVAVKIPGIARISSITSANLSQV
jgi:hypothetical protein